MIWAPPLTQLRTAPEGCLGVATRLTCTPELAPFLSRVRFSIDPVPVLYPARMRDLALHRPVS